MAAIRKLFYCGFSGEILWIMYLSLVFSHFLMLGLLSVMFQLNTFKDLIKLKKEPLNLQTDLLKPLIGQRDWSLFNQMLIILFIHAFKEEIQLMLIYAFVPIYCQ